MAYQRWKIAIFQLVFVRRIYQKNGRGFCLSLHPPPKPALINCSRLLASFSRINGFSAYKMTSSLG
ncbi:hypothetical protein CO181_02770 [candidate division WWE3 bacterium CG_4_9_14_3_um_filter_43_9]|uniref:Uncharacterized protein n=1 Tax=candidate division WWE3 bacterium CG_4_9_14_3_um_filter_43_9 TaxID=1975082 RepID=A0A2M7WX57_UNCKA|nr:MAG: hypothetical protein CO181_02770 [candidate division WWE3 bacterium CG_4_9_14_3_um_filter_43_9]